MIMYKVINDHAAPNLKQSLLLYREDDTTHDLRNHTTEFIQNQTGNLSKGVLNTMELSIGKVYQMKQGMRTRYCI